MTKKLKSVAQAYDEATVQETNAQTVQENNAKSNRITTNSKLVPCAKKCGFGTRYAQTNAKSVRINTDSKLFFLDFKCEKLRFWHPKCSNRREIPLVTPPISQQEIYKAQPSRRTLTVQEREGRKIPTNTTQRSRGQPHPKCSNQPPRTRIHFSEPPISHQESNKMQPTVQERERGRHTHNLRPKTGR